MKICFTQPAFVPWPGVFARLIHSDLMIVLDDTLFARGFTFVNRNRIKGSRGEVWITVPIKKKGKGRQRIKDLEIASVGKWSVKFLATLKHCYGRSIHYDQYFPNIQRIIEKHETRFIDLVNGLFDYLVHELEIQTSIAYQSKLGTEDMGDQLLIRLAHECHAREVIMPFLSQNTINCKLFEQNDLKLSFLHYQSPVYPQFWGDYCKNLSVLDLLFCTGREADTIIKKGYKIIEFK